MHKSELVKTSHTGYCNSCIVSIKDARTRNLCLRTWHRASTSDSPSSPKATDPDGLELLIRICDHPDASSRLSGLRASLGRTWCAGDRGRAEGPLVLSVGHRSAMFRTTGLPRTRCTFAARWCLRIYYCTQAAMTDDTELTDAVRRYSYWNDSSNDRCNAVSNAGRIRSPLTLLLRSSSMMGDGVCRPHYRVSQGMISAVRCQVSRLTPHLTLKHALTRRSVRLPSDQRIWGPK